jgi:hypothetical protein
MPLLNRRQFLAAAAATGAVSSLSQSAFALANDEISVGFISCGGRAREHMNQFKEMSGVNVTALCDPDGNALASAARQFPGAKTFPDLRDLLDDKSLDAVVIATTNHWHCLASIWAMQAGKHVYVEKPLSHSQWEGRQTVNAARAYRRVCAIGTQQRSDPMQAEIKRFLHEEQALGKIESARVNRYGVRAPIGKRTEPLPIPDHVSYDIWLGPAQDLPIYRDKLQYDWHWVWNTGSGEMGNWGVHVLDDLRNNVFLDKVTLPRRMSISFTSTPVRFLSSSASAICRPGRTRRSRLNIPARGAAISPIAKVAGSKGSAVQARRSTRTEKSLRNSRATAATACISATSSKPSAPTIRRGWPPTFRSVTIPLAGATWRTSPSAPVNNSAARRPQRLTIRAGSRSLAKWNRIWARTRSSSTVPKLRSARCSKWIPPKKCSSANTRLPQTPS